MRDPAEAMSERPAYETDDVGHPKRWQILAILNLSLVLIVAGVSGLNLAIPSIQSDYARKPF